MSAIVTQGSVVVLTGGIGGAKLLLGMTRAFAGRITAIVNTGDDFQHLGLYICPDIDTTAYTLAGLADPVKGWGRADETWNFMAALRDLGGADWFALGDRDLAVHVERTRRLAAGETLGAISADFARRWGVGVVIAPMSDQPVRTRVATAEGELAFQHYFVARRCEPAVTGVRFDGALQARPSPTALAALAAPDLRAIVIAPSNPWLSVDPILAVPGMLAAIRGASCPVVAVTPLPGGKAVKGPTAKIMAELGLRLSAQSIAEHYSGVVDAVLLDHDDPDIDLPYARINTVMTDLESKTAVARAALDLAEDHPSRRRCLQ